MKAVVAAFNQEKALVGSFSAIVQLCRLIVNSSMKNAEQSTSDLSADILQNVNNGPRKIQRHSGMVQMGSFMTILKWNVSLYHKGSHVYTSWRGGRCCKIWGHHCFYHLAFSPLKLRAEKCKICPIVESSSAQNLHKYPATNFIRAPVQIHPLLS